MKRILFLLFIFVLGCTKNSNRVDQINISIPSDISTLDPANCYDTVCYVPLTQVYEPLYEIEYLKRPYTLRPLLAEGFPEISNNRLKYTFKIKKGIKYHESDILPKGREIKSQDFVNQIKRLAFKGTRSQGFFLVDQKIKGINDWRDNVQTDLSLFFSEPIPGVSAPDDHTLVIELIRPYPQLLWAMAMSFTAPVPEEAIKATQNDLRQKFVGTGPYIITNYNPSQEVVLKKNENYISSVYPSQGDRFANENSLLADAGAKLPFVKNIRISVIEETQTEWLNFMSKKIDLVNLTKDQYPLALTQDGKLKPEITKNNIRLQASPTLIY